MIAAEMQKCLRAGEHYPDSLHTIQDANYILSTTNLLLLFFVVFFFFSFFFLHRNKNCTPPRNTDLSYIARLKFKALGKEIVEWFTTIFQCSFYFSVSLQGQLKKKKPHTHHKQTKQNPCIHWLGIVYITNFLSYPPLPFKKCWKCSILNTCKWNKHITAQRKVF